MSSPQDAARHPTSLTSAATAVPIVLSWRWIFALLILVGIGDVALAQLTTTGGSPPVVTWWSTVGIGTGLLALSSPRRWPVLVVGLVAAGLLARIASAGDVDVSAQVAALHAGEALLTAAILTGLGRRRATLRTVGDLVRLAAAALAGGTLALATEGLPLTSGELGHAGTVTVLPSHAASILLIAALALSATQRRSRASVDELAVQVLLTAVVTAAVFGPAQDLPLVFAPIPFLVWAAVRLDVGVVAAELLAFSVATTLLTSEGSGPFAARYLSAASSVALAQVYVVAAVLVTLPIALATQQRQRLLERVQQDEMRFRNHFSDSPLGMVFLHQEDGRLVVDDGNDAASRILAVEPQDLPGRSLAQLIDTFEPLSHVVGTLCRGKVETWHGTAEALGRESSRIDVALTRIGTRRGVPINSAQLLDVTQEHDARRRLEAAHKLTDATLDTTACVIMVTDASGTIVRVNSATKEITGFDEIDLVGRALWDSPIAPLDRAETEAMFTWPNRSGSPIVREVSAQARDGSRLRLVWNNNIVRDEIGMPAYAVLTGIDVTAERSSTSLMMQLMRSSTFTALVGIDDDGLITMTNAGAERMLGYHDDELVGRPFVDLLDAEELHERTASRPDQNPFLELVGATLGREPTDWTWRTRSGHQLGVAMTLSTTDENVNAAGFLCVGRDVTEQRESQQTVVAALERERDAANQLRVLDRAKDDFVSTVSHELRTPVTSILGYSEMLRDELERRGGDQHHVAMLATITRNAERLTVICNDLLLLGGADHLLDVQRHDLDLGDVIAAVDDATRPLLLGRQLTLRFVEPLAQACVHGDRAQLERVLINLVSNAIKFTPDGGEIEVKLLRDRDEAVLSVSDTGRGIDPVDQAQVFERFFRTGQAQAEAIQGTGLGLAIVRGIVEAHGGRIDVTSALDQGASFTVHLPLAEPASDRS